MLISSWDVVTCLEGGVEGWANIDSGSVNPVNFYAKGYFQLSYRDLTGGFKCFKTNSPEALDLSSIQSTGYNFQVEVTHQAHHLGLRIMKHLSYLSNVKKVSPNELGNMLGSHHWHVETAQASLEVIMSQGLEPL